MSNLNDLMIRKFECATYNVNYKLQFFTHNKILKVFDVFNVFSWNFAEDTWLIDDWFLLCVVDHYQHFVNAIYVFLFALKFLRGTVTINWQTSDWKAVSMSSFFIEDTFFILKISWYYCAPFLCSLSLFLFNF